MKSLLRETRMSGGAVEKVRRIIKNLRDDPPARDLNNASGAKLFAIWRAHRESRRQRNRNKTRIATPLSREHLALIENYFRT